MRAIVKIHPKTLAALACAGVFTLATGQSSRAQNLLADPGFETGLTAPNPNPTGLTGWANLAGQRF